MATFHFRHEYALFLLSTIWISVVLIPGACQIIQDRKFVHSKEELLLTQKVSEQLHHPGCKGSSNSEIAIIVHSAAQSTGIYYERRQVTRETWVRDAQANHIQVIFAIGLPRDPQTQLELIEEQSQYGDMVQFEFIDNYYNLTLKAIAVVSWLHKHCSMMSIIAKVDDDLFVNIERLIQLRHTFTRGITGYSVRNNPPDRNSASKFYMPEDIFPDSFYPTSVSGYFYVMTQDIIEPLSQGASIWNEMVLDIDDVYITGIVCELLGVERIRSSEMLFREVEEGCHLHEINELENFIAFHGCSCAEDYRELYLQWREFQGLEVYVPMRFNYFNFIVSVGPVTLIFVLGIYLYLFQCKRSTRIIFKRMYRKTCLERITIHNTCKL